ncbi:type IV pilus secretin PilQ [Desulfuromonas acetoxidans]|uniref:type IV pilus secretin PilQ n=1 Tax=Desulfuromonas acetoxidans TaxID=891 RepID=UPI00292F7432|nr:type IV pilus secretin PilQ [Desulfuromonas acetoxidans]
MSVLKPVRKMLGYAAVVLSLFFSLLGMDNSVAQAEMATVEDVVIADTSAVLKIDGADVNYDFYTLGAPSRLVVDVSGVLPLFEERTFDVASGFSAIRVGIYADKTRFVFDSASEQMPDVKVESSGNDIVVDWSGITSIADKPRAEKPVSVTAINFNAEEGSSTFTVNFDGGFDLIDAVMMDDTIRFGANDTVIPRSLRRVVDASVFPSAVLQITPYSTIIDGMRNVMFSAKMKGPVQYSVIKSGNKLVFSTIDGVFAEASSKSLDTFYVPVQPISAESSETSMLASEQSFVFDEKMDEVTQVLNKIEGEAAGGLLAATADQDAPKSYTGEPVTLVLDDADIRKVMQLIAEISNLNIILSDDVKGNVSLRLHDVPWDQALDLILDIKQLGTISQGNVVRILPLSTIKKMEEERLRASKDIKKLEETRTEIFVINYKDTDAIEEVIDDVLSDQGEVQVIEGSKKIMVNDIPSKLDEIRLLIAELDEPVKQVVIEARIVEADTSAEQSFGIHWGFEFDNDSGSSGGGIGSSLDNAAVGLGGAFTTPTSATDGLGTALTFGRVGLDTVVLDLQLSALESSGGGKVISSPKVMALDGETARIGQGTEIPYKTTSDSGTTTEFKKAELALEVTPLINPDNTILLEILATNSSPGVSYTDGVAINTKEAETKLLLKNGETTVIGGIYTENEQKSDSGTPFLKDLPFVGNLFKYKTNSNDRTELLVFLTPHIVD